ncbi:YdeI/OmpD-associated family protein [Chryseobacterium indoltheticum]|uniref:YdeI/OmpD-associated family protein n=1 Tax=Chryseobacterium indoltheticum TaxID=254 RepID=UPI004041D4F2
MNLQAEQFFEKAKKWKEEFYLLREIITENDSLEENYKWMHPCYTLDGKNVVLIHGFKEYCALLFHKGVLIKDPQNILIQQTENVQSARQIRFRNIEEVEKQRAIIKKYIQEAVKIEQSGQKVELKKVSEYPVPEEFQRALDEDKALNESFYALSPGRQKGYLFYFNQAKQSKTRETRIEKYYQNILDGKGIDD